ncbi:hypothetical protein GGR25_001489 [Kaistia hirudinis]|uniref:Uncharacterized protein n=1 Tax=Kaistia hirudinis TaxID=1293440 RepID=A0A840AJP1_9HYPH|nr:hypothetical protein [Kaistia hirudinis]MBB3930450.1 hypothetical protein [Kaistia hirudinis]
MADFKDMAGFKAEDGALASLVLLEELFSMLAQSGIVPQSKLGDVVRSAAARLDTSDHFGAGAAIQHYFEAWLRD